jgi:hypothetical protein
MIQPAAGETNSSLASIKCSSGSQQHIAPNAEPAQQQSSQ